MNLYSKAAYSIIWARRFIGPTNYLPNDQAVVDVFNEIAKDLVPNPYAYTSVKAGIKSHFRNKLKIWMLDWRYSSRPWSILAFINALVFSLALSVLQTYYAGNPPKRE